MPRFEVRISGDGFAEIDGAPLVPASGQAVNDAVLDQLQRYAEERAEAVEATVDDSVGGETFVLQVLPDGSSLVLPPDEVPAPEPEPAAVATAVATAVTRARARAAAVAHAADVASAARAPAPTAPAELAEPIGRINALVDLDRLDEAFDAATALREGLTSSVGAEHPYALEVRSMEAYIAYLRGDHREAIVLALVVARIRCGTGDARASDEVARAAAAWQQLDEDRVAVAHGRELLHMWDALERRRLLPAGHAELAGQIRRQVAEMAAYI